MPYTEWNTRYLNSLLLTEIILTASVSIILILHPDNAPTTSIGSKSIDNKVTINKRTKEKVN